MIERRWADALSNVAQTAPVEGDRINFAPQLAGCERRIGSHQDAVVVIKDGILHFGRNGRQRMIGHDQSDRVFQPLAQLQLRLHQSIIRRRLRVLVQQCLRTKFQLTFRYLM